MIDMRLLTRYRTPIHTVLLSLAVLVIFGIICTLSTKKLHQIILWFAPINILATVGICIALLVCTPDKRSASFVFTHFTDGSGWGNKGWSFLLGFLNVAWVMTDYDATTHLSEETHDAAIRGPYAIVNAIFVTGVLGFILNVTFGFCLTENYMDDIVNSPTGFPVAQIFLNAGGRSGGTAMLFLVILVQFFTGASALLANARMTYAFSRDEALPFSNFFSHINRVTGTPVNSVWLVVIFCACLNLIGLGSTQTITAIFNLCAPCLDLSYVAVICAHLWYSKRVNFIRSFRSRHDAQATEGQQDLEHHRHHLGRLHQRCLVLPNKQAGDCREYELRNRRRWLRRHVLHHLVVRGRSEQVQGTEDAGYYGRSAGCQSGRVKEG